MSSREEAQLTQPARLVLASTSPSRLSILRNAGVEPIVVSSGVDEDALIAGLDSPSPSQVVEALAVAKAQAGWHRLGEEQSQLRTGNCVLIGGDSMLLIDGELQGKPHTEAETIRRWENQRGKVAELLTGHALLHCLTGSGQPRMFTEVTRTRIHFATPADEDIAAYAATGEPFGCAGAFTLEALGGWFINRIEGDPSSVIGLSLPVVRRGVEHFGFHFSNFWNITH